MLLITWRSHIIFSTISCFWVRGVFLSKVGSKSPSILSSSPLGLPSRPLLTSSTYSRCTLFLFHLSCLWLSAIPCRATAYISFTSSINLNFFFTSFQLRLLPYRSTMDRSQNIMVYSSLGPACDSKVLVKERIINCANCDCAYVVRLV